MSAQLAAWMLAALLAQSPAQATAEEEVADLVTLDKSERRLSLWADGERIRSYRVALGPSPRGRKEREGDGRTPEGRYVLDYRNANSAFHRAIHVSYPNAADRASAEARGESPGGDIMIHGQKNGFGWAAFLTQRFDWTEGCIAVSNGEMDEIWSMVGAGTPIEIVP